MSNSDTKKPIKSIVDSVSESASDQSLNGIASIKVSSNSSDTEEIFVESNRFADLVSKSALKLTRNSNENQSINESSYVTIIGNNSNNILTGTLESDRIFARAGDDVIKPGLGNNIVNGGKGTDTVSFEDVSSQGYGVIANLKYDIAKVVEPSMVAGRSGYNIRSLFTIGNSTPNGYTPPGEPDGIGAYALDSDTVRILVNHEVTNEEGYAYTVNGSVSLTGARVSYFDINKTTLAVESGGLAYTKLYGYDGKLITDANQLGIPILENGQLTYQGRNEDGTTLGLDRFCSGSIFEANEFGSGNGFVDRIFFAPQETTDGVYVPINVDTGEAYLAPALSYGHWENLAAVDTGSQDKVAMILGNDWSGLPVPILLYVGEKNAKGDGSFLDRNGLAEGKLYAWKSYNSNYTDPTNFFGSGTSSAGEFVELDYYDPSKAGTEGYDAYGYALEQTVTDMAIATGAMSFARIEDQDTNPNDGTQVVFNATGRSTLFDGADTWGGTYTIDLDFSGSGSPKGSLNILYDGDYDPNHAIRSQDNVDWSKNGYIYVQEDAAADWNSVVNVNANDGSIIRLDPKVVGGNPTTVAEIDRSTLLPVGSTDAVAGEIGEWETSGILDVSELFGYEQPGSLFIFDTQAHGIEEDPSNLVEGGQLNLLYALGVKPSGPAPIGTTKLTSIENLTGSNYTDKLTGNSGVNVLKGMAGDDLLDGGTGNDILYGNTGNDIFVLNRIGTDSMMDFTAGSYVPGSLVKGDRIGLSNGLKFTDLSFATFTNGTTSGTSISKDSQILATVLGVEVNILSSSQNFVSV
jgi:RTX calcium-binding nonapeptide repeat (4 copies)